MYGSVCSVEIQDGRKPCVVMCMRTVGGGWGFLCEKGLLGFGEKRPCCFGGARRGHSVGVEVVKSGQAVYV